MRNVRGALLEEARMPIVPKGEHVERVPVSFRMPIDLRDELERVGQETGHTMTDALMYLLRYALQRYAEEQSEQRKREARDERKAPK